MDTCKKRNQVHIEMVRGGAIACVQLNVTVVEILKPQHPAGYITPAAVGRDGKMRQSPVPHFTEEFSFRHAEVKMKPGIVHLRHVCAVGTATIFLMCTPGRFWRISKRTKLMVEVRTMHCPAHSPCCWPFEFVSRFFSAVK